MRQIGVGRGGRVSLVGVWVWALFVGSACQDSATDAGKDSPEPSTDSGAPDDSGPDDSGAGDSDPDDSDPSDSGGDSGAPLLGPAVLRVGPPAPAVGIYGIAADDAWVYVSNLHVPFVTLVDPATGAWQGAIDLRDAGITAAFFPRLFLFRDRLWVTQQNEDRLVRVVVPDGAPDGEVSTPGRFGGVASDGSSLWVSLIGDEIVGYDGVNGSIVGRFSAPSGSALAVEDQHFAVLDAVDHQVSLLDRAGVVLWEASLPDEATLNDIAVIDGRVFVTERASGDVIVLEAGEVLGRVHTGSDTFGLYRDGATLYVTNRQGAALSDAGAYDGTPARLTAMNRDFEVLWTVDVARTIHFVANDGERLWVANEDSLQVSAIDPLTHAEVLRGPRLGLTLDSVSSDDVGIYAGSHLTDEVWRMGFGTEAGVGSAEGAAVCGWPFVVVPMGDSLGVPCQESGDVVTMDSTTLAVTALDDVATSFHVPCPDGLCTGHKQFLSATEDQGVLVWTEPATAALRWADGRSLVVRDSVEFAAKIHHFDVRSLGGGLVVYEPIDERLLRVEAGVVVASVDVPAIEAAFPLVIDGDRVWVGATAYDSALSPVASLPGGDVVAVSGQTVVSQDGDVLVAYVDGVESARLPVSELEAPPWTSLSGDPGPLRFGVVDGELIIANTFRGTLERRRLPSLGPAGEGIVPVGSWAGLDGLR